MTSVFDDAGARFERAVHSGSWAEARTLLAGYVSALEAFLAGPPRGSAEAAAAVQGAIGLLRRAARAAQAGRAHTASELARISALRPYRGLAARSASTFTLEG